MMHRIFNLFLVIALAGSLVSSSLASAPVRADDSTSANSSSEQASTTGHDSIRDQIEKNKATTDSALAAFRAAKQGNKLTALKKFGDTSASNRLEALTKLREQLDSGFCSSINASVKTLILADIAAVESNITTQQTKFDDDTDLDIAKTEVKNIFTANRVFVHFIPAVRGICTSEKIVELVDNKITPLITQLSTDGKDTTQVSADAAAAKSAANSALTLYEKVAANPGANDTNNGDIQTANTDLAKARSSLAAVKADLEKLKS